MCRGKAANRTARMEPQMVPIPMEVRETRADASRSFWAKDFAIKLVAPILKNSRGRGALSLMVDAGPSDASSRDVDNRPIKEASISDIRGGQT